MKVGTSLGIHGCIQRQMLDHLNYTSELIKQLQDLRTPLLRSAHETSLGSFPRPGLLHWLMRPSKRKETQGILRRLVYDLVALSPLKDMSTPTLCRSPHRAPCSLSAAADVTFPNLNLGLKLNPRVL
jgi:hypothetical protein